MTPTELTALSERLTALGAYFDRPLNETQSEIYLAGLEDLPIAAVVAALTQWVKTGRPFMPKVSEIRELIVGTEADQAEHAWTQLRAAMRRAGAYASLVVSDAALAATSESLWGSWPQACADDLSPEMWASRRKEFGRLYRVARLRGVTGQRHLPGLHEQQNREAGHSFRWTPVWVLDDAGVRALSPTEAIARLEERNQTALPLAPIAQEESV